MRGALVALLGGAAASEVTGGVLKLNWSDCGDSSTHGHITELQPTSVTLGTKTSLAGKGTIDEAVQGATYKVDAKAAGITVFKHNGDACKPEVIKLPAGAGELDMKGFACPLSAGNVELDLDLTLSATIPASLARVTIDLTAATASGDKALCVKIKTAPAATDFEGIADHINSLNTTWKATTPKFESLDHVKRLCGSILPGEEGYEAPEEEKEDDSSNMDIPDNFDVRTQWPKCASISGHIRDQSECGSCWAHGPTEAFNDRACIANGEKALLSTEDTLANSGAGSCGGGSPGGVWNWIKRTGVVTGGDYTDKGKGTTCAPYSLPTCQHHNFKHPTPQHPACPKTDYPTPRRFSTCKESGYKKSYRQDKVKGTSSYSVRGVKNIQSDIMQYGSVGATLTVYGDLPAYSSGVYQHHSGGMLGGHAVKMMGWGTENGTPYWLIANSWNTDWGDKGFFKILRGRNECGIESGISAGHAGKSIELV